MALHRFIATPIADSPIFDLFRPEAEEAGTAPAPGQTAEGDEAASQDAEAEMPEVQIPFERYYGIGSFPSRTTDALYVDEIIKACKATYGIDLTPYYYPDAERTATPTHLFDVTDLTAQADNQQREQFRQDWHQLKQTNRKTHTSFFYIFVRPIQILVIIGIFGYMVYLSVVHGYFAPQQDDELQQDAQQEEEQY